MVVLVAGRLVRRPLLPIRNPPLLVLVPGPVSLLVLQARPSGAVGLRRSQMVLGLARRGPKVLPSLGRPVLLLVLLLVVALLLVLLLAVVLLLVDPLRAVLRRFRRRGRSGVPGCCFSQSCPRWDGS